MSIPHSTAPIHAAHNALLHAMAGATAAPIGAVNAIHEAISHTVSHNLVALESALSSHSIGVLMSVASLPLNVFSTAAIYFPNIFSAPHFQALSIHCPSML